MNKSKRLTLRTSVVIVLLLSTVLTTIAPNAALAGGSLPVKNVGTNGSSPPIK